ncbi:hypothetical protein Tco_1480730, partial [Tanacetum coccineum]
MVAATEPKTIQKVVQISGALTDEAIRYGSIKKVEKIGNMREPSNDKNGRDDNKRTRTGNAFATTANPIGRENTGIRSIKVGSTIVGIKSFLMLFGVTAALIDVHAAQSKLVLLENFNEKYSKCLRLLYKVNVAEGVNAASEEVSTAYVICMRYFGIRSIKVGSTIVGIKSFLMLFGVTAALIDVHAAQSKLVLL